MNARHALSGLALTLALAAGSSASAADGFADKAELEALAGTYASSVPESWYGGFGTREFTFEDGRWGLTFTHALDPKMEMKTFRFRTEGPYAIGAASTTIEGAYEGDFTEARKFVTLLTEDPKLIEAFGFASCDLTANVEVDISQSGCASWKPVAECGVDHDLLAKDANGLHFGVRPADNDMCTPDKRPTALLAPVVER